MTSDAQPPYTVRRVQELLGISRAVITRLVGAGFVTPTRGHRNEHRFSFQDLVLLRTAYGLQQAKIPPRKILSSLLKLRANLPQELPLSGMRISAVGAEVTVHDRQGNWAAESGQLLMDFEVTPFQGAVAFIQPSSAEVLADDPQALLARGQALEGTDAASAEVAYRQALSMAPDYIDAYLNLGALLCEAKRCSEALQLYEVALTRCPPSAPLHFNHAIALQDQGYLAEAVKSYEHCLKLDSALADAHYNLGMLDELLGDARGALRHFSAFRRLNR